MACLAKEAGAVLINSELDGPSLNVEVPLGAGGDKWR